MDKPKILIQLDNGRVDEVYSTTPIEVEIVETDINGCDEDQIFRLSSGEQWSYYTRFGTPQVNKPVVNRFFKAINKKREVEAEQ